MHPYLTPVCPRAVDGVDPHVGDVEHDGVVIPGGDTAVIGVGIDHEGLRLEELRRKVDKVFI